MCRYMLLFLLVNIYGQSLGIPVSSQVWIPNLFTDLAKRCKNEFVSTQIAVKVKDCNVTTPPLHDVQFRCLVFYDASSLLCDIPVASLSNFSADFAVKTSEKYNVSSFCDGAAHFNIPATPNQNMMTKIFRGDVLCKNVCVDEELLLTGDTNFVCKYFKWMLEVVQAVSTHGVNTTTETSGRASVPELKLTSGEGKNIVVTTSNNNSTSDGAQKLLEDTDKVVQLINEKEPKLLNGNAASGFAHSTERVASDKNPQMNPTLVKPKHVDEKNDKIGEADRHSSLDSKADNDNTNNIAVNNAIGKDNVIENPQQGNGIDDDENDDAGLDIVGEDNKEDNIDEGDDSEDHISDVEVKPNNEEKPLTNHVETQMTLNGEGSQRDIFPNAMSDAFPEDDDHFFPFFLTAVILVVVLYILYHNKNKVSKMFFGLIVEGRQPGRRRNSRGHSYRRLDTLEQAMSANSPAPPSKIIY